MGRDKALLPLGQETFLTHLLGTLDGEVSPLVVVLGHHADEIESRIQAARNVHILRNPDYPSGQLSSLKVALRFLQKEPLAGAMVCLVDHPAIAKTVIRQMLERFRQTSSRIVIPMFQGRRGHPVLFAASLFTELLDAPLDAGARFVVSAHANEVELVETGEEGILLDVDRPADYEALLQRWVSLTGTGGTPSEGPL